MTGPHVLVYTQVLETTTCWCGINLALPKNLLEWARENERNRIYCPLGHEFVFRNGYKKKLERERELREEAERREKATRDLLAAEERSHAATRGHLTRVKKRTDHGVCPCCNRSFQQLARHMKAKHPDYAESNGNA